MTVGGEPKMAALKKFQVMQTISLLIAVCFTGLDAHAKYSGGTGEPNDPYQIATADDLILLGERPEDYDKHFILTADIDLDPNLPERKVFDKAFIAPDTDSVRWGFQGIPFTGVLDGNGHAISHLTIMGDSYLGLFGQLGAEVKVKDLGVLDVEGVLDINIADAGFSNLGGLVGYNRGSIKQCYSSGMITGGFYVGGLVGENDGDVNNCYSSCSVTGNCAVGGLVGFNWGVNIADLDGDIIDREGNITECYSTSVVTGSYYVGGLVGNNVGNIINCYSIGAVMGNEAIGGLVGMNGLQGAIPYPGYIDKCYSHANVRGEIFVGGLVGDNRVGDVTQCYSTGRISGNEKTGGLVGLNDWGLVLYSVWDVETSGLSGSAGGTGKTTAEMQTANTFLEAGWDFVDETANGTEDIWWINEGKDYPRLWWEDAKP